MIYHRVQGRLAEGYKVLGDFKKIDSEDICFNGFVNYVFDAREETRPQMLFGYPSLSENGESVYVIGENLMVGGKDEVFVRESHFSHKVIFSDEDYFSLTKDMTSVPYVNGLCKNIENFDQSRPPKITFSNHTVGDLAALASVYGINEDNYFDFVYGLCITAFDKDTKLYIAVADNDEESIEGIKHFISTLIDALPMFLRKRFGFVTYFPSNDISKTDILPKGVNCVFIKSTRKNSNNYSVCDITFDKPHGYAYYAQTEAIDEDIVFLLCDKIFKGDHSSDKLFEEIDRLFPPKYETSFETIVAYYIRYNYQSIGELYWADKVLWLSGIPEIRELMIEEDTVNAKDNLFKEDSKIARVKLNIIDDRDFQREISRELCRKFKPEDETVEEYFSRLSKPISSNNGESYEEKTVSLLREEFEYVLFNEEEFVSLAFGEIGKELKKAVGSANGTDEKTKAIIEVLKKYDKNKCMLMPVLQDGIFAYISGEILSDNSLYSRKMLHDYCNENPEFGTLSRRLYEETDAFLTEIAQNEEYLAAYTPVLMSEEIGNTFLMSFAEKNSIIKAGISDKLKLDILIKRFNDADSFKSKMLVLTKDSDSEELYNDYFPSFSPTLRFLAKSPDFTDIRDKEALTFLCLFLNDDYRFEKDHIEEDLREIINGHLLETDMPGSMKNLFENMFKEEFFEGTPILDMLKETADEILKKKKAIKVVDKTLFGELNSLVHEYLDTPMHRVYNINNYIDRSYYKTHRLPSIMGEYVMYINITPSAITAKYFEEEKAEKTEDTFSSVADEKQQKGFFDMFGKIKR